MTTPILDAIAQFANVDDGANGWLLTKANAKALLEEIGQRGVFKPSEQDFRAIKDFLPKQRVSGL